MVSVDTRNYLGLINNPAPRGGVFREETVSHSRVASERDVGLADASKVRRKRRGMRPKAIHQVCPTEGDGCDVAAGEPARCSCGLFLHRLFAHGTSRTDLTRLPCLSSASTVAT